MKYSWPYQNTPYLSALPGVGGPGLDVSNGDKPSKIYLITSRENVKEGGSVPELGPNVFAGTLWWVQYADQGEEFSKWVLPLESGYAYHGDGLNAPDGRGDLDYVGHAAPGAGLIIQCTSMNMRGSNTRIWHMASWVGDQPTMEGQSFEADQRDCLQASSSTVDVNRIAHINCDARFSMDESVQVWYEAQGCSWIRGAIYDPLHTPPDFAMPDDPNHAEGVDHGYGHLISGKADYSLTMQSLYAHTTDRNPLVATPNHAHINNLHYNHGRPHVAAGVALNISDNGDHNEAQGRTMQCNCVGNVSVRGPEQNDSIVLAKVLTVTPGSTGHSANNSCFGWPSPASQEGFFTSQPEDYLRSTVRRSAWPQGLGANYDGTLKPCADPLSPRVQEGLAFSQLMRETVGCMPARRYLYQGGVNKVLDQIDAAIRGVPFDGGQYVNTVEEAGGWPALPTLSLDPKNPTADWHAPFPFGADRDDVYDSGFLVDGSSRAGLNKIREWVINQYHFVMGR